MHYFQKFKTYLNTDIQEEQKSSKPSAVKNSDKKEEGSTSTDSYQLIMLDILEDSQSIKAINEADQAKGSDYFQDLVFEEAEHEELENLYIKDFIFVNKLEEAREITDEEWEQVIKEENLSVVPKKNIYFSIFKGIKYEVRRKVWELFANTSSMKEKTYKTYAQLIDPSGISEQNVIQIDKDVPRSKSTTTYLKELRNILIAYCAFSGKDYVQGMNLIAGSLLKLLSLENDDDVNGFFEVVEIQFEERVFWVFIGIMIWKEWEGIFERNLEGLKTRLTVLESLMAEHVPAVYQKIIDFEWDLTIFSQYYITIMLYNTPIGFSKIILDLFFLDGENVLHSLIIRMMKMQEDKILGCMDECEIMNYFKKDMINDCYISICKNQINAKKLEDFEINFMKINKN